MALERLDLDDPLDSDAAAQPLYLIFVTRNLMVDGLLVSENTDGATGLVVLGDLIVGDIVVGGQQVYVGGTLRVSNLSWGDYNHGELPVKGHAKARVMAFTDEYYAWIGDTRRARDMLDLTPSLPMTATRAGSGSRRRCRASWSA